MGKEGGKLALSIEVLLFIRETVNETDSRVLPVIRVLAVLVVIVRCLSCLIARLGTNSYLISIQIFGRVSDFGGSFRDLLGGCRCEVLELLLAALP